MFKQLQRPSHSTLVAYLALFVALGGTGYAAATITGADVVDESLTGADVKGKAATSTVAAVNGGLNGNDISGQPANAVLGQPFVPGSLSTYDIADNTLTGTDVNETTLAKVPAATNADKLGGVAAKPVLRSVAPASFDHDRCSEDPPATATFCSIGPAPGDVRYVWQNLGGIWVPAGFYKDAFGIVHLEGVVTINSPSTSDAVIFILPAGYRPAEPHIFIVTGRTDSEPKEGHGRVDVTNTGGVEMTIRPNQGSIGGLAHLSLDGISFRAA